MSGTAISGSRTFTDRLVVERAIDRLVSQGKKLLIPCGDSGCTAGVDTFSHAYAEHIWAEHDVFYALWKRYGKRAGFIRNEEMVTKASELVAFLGDGPSPGTQHALYLASKRRIPFHVYHAGRWTSMGHDVEPDKGSVPGWMRGPIPQWLRSFLIEEGYQLQ